VSQVGFCRQLGQEALDRPCVEGSAAALGWGDPGGDRGSAPF